MKIICKIEKISMQHPKSMHSVLRNKTNFFLLQSNVTISKNVTFLSRNYNLKHFWHVLNNVSFIMKCNTYQSSGGNKGGTFCHHFHDCKAIILWRIQGKQFCYSIQYYIVAWFRMLPLEALPLVLPWIPLFLHSL